MPNPKPPPPKKPNLPFLDDDEQPQLENPEDVELEAHDDETREHAPLNLEHHEHKTGLNDEDDEATVAVAPIKVTNPANPRPNRHRR